MMGLFLLSIRVQRSKRRSKQVSMRLGTFTSKSCECETTGRLIAQVRHVAMSICKLEVTMLPTGFALQPIDKPLGRVSVKTWEGRMGP